LKFNKKSSSSKNIFEQAVLLKPKAHKEKPLAKLALKIPEKIEEEI